MQISFEGKTAIITGGASGMGAATARLIAGAGGNVVIADCNHDAGRKIAEELGNAACFVPTDVTREGDATALAAASIKAFGHIDILINNAGKGAAGDVATLDLAEWQNLLTINLTSAFLVTKAVIPHLQARGGGTIVNIGSISGIAGDYGMIAYNAAKAGLINLTRSLALNHAKEGIRVNAICPGVIADTAMAAPLRDGPGGLAVWNSRIPMRRTGLAIEVAHVMAFLASDLSSYMTGSVIVVDGGVTAHTGLPTFDDFMIAR